MENNELKLGEMMSRNLKLMSDFNGKMMDLIMVNLGTYSWFDEQWVKMVNNRINQSKTLNEELVRISKEITTRLQENRAFVEDIAKESLATIGDNLAGQVPLLDYSDLVEQVDEISKKAEAKTAKVPLAKKAAAAPAAKPAVKPAAKTAAKPAPKAAAKPAPKAAAKPAPKAATKPKAKKAAPKAKAAPKTAGKPRQKAAPPAPAAPTAE
ncbi:MAG: hypothetical protein ACM3UZ_11350 [Acidobacteriota bacterium]